MACSSPSVIPLVVPWPAATTLFTSLFAAHDPSFWSLSPVGAFASIALIGIWKGTPWCYLLLMAALSTTPVELFKAARVDGAGARFFWMHIVLPLVRPMLVFVIVLRVLAEAQTYTSVALLTQGGPYYSTQLASYYGYQLAFTSFDWGVACALGTLLGAALLLVAVFGWLSSTPRKATVHAPAFLGRLVTRPHAMVVTHRVFPPLLAIPLRVPEQTPPCPTEPTASRPLTHAKLGRNGLLTVMGLFVLLPFTKGLPATSEFRYFGAEWRFVSSGVWNSLLVTAATLVGTFMLAFPAASCSRVRSFLGAAPCFSSCCSPWRSRESFCSCRSTRRSPGSISSTLVLVWLSSMSLRTFRWPCSSCVQRSRAFRNHSSRVSAWKACPELGSFGDWSCRCRRARSSRSASS